MDKLTELQVAAHALAMRVLQSDFYLQVKAEVDYVLVLTQSK